MRCIPAIATTTLGLLIGAKAEAGRISPELQAELSALRPEANASAILMLEARADMASLENALALRHAGRAERHREVVTTLRETARRSQVDLLAELSRLRSTGQVERFRAFWIANAIVVEARPGALLSLAARGDVRMAASNARISLPPEEPMKRPDGERRVSGVGVPPGLRAIRVPEVWHQLGIHGQGMLVGTLDTGVDGQHPALASRWRGNNGHPWQECWLDLRGTGFQSPHDTGTHGTHVMGTITGLGAATNDSIGIAWGAQWIACNGAPSGQGSFAEDVIAAYQWFADPDLDPLTVDDVPDVVNNSWIAGSDCASGLGEAIDNLEAAGVALTYSAGNEGSGPSTIMSPADRAISGTSSFAIGAVDATHFNFPYPIADFSSRGPTRCDVPTGLRLKPEVVAPGVDVYSCVPGNGYLLASGTSMAGPHAAGVLALIRQINPDLDVETAKEILLQSTRDEGPVGEDNNYGWGFIDAFAAVTLAASTELGTLSGHVTNASGGGSPIAGATVALLPLYRLCHTDANGFYARTVVAGLYNVEASHPLFLTQTASNVPILAGQSTVRNFGLIDAVAPAFAEVSFAGGVFDPGLPIPIDAMVHDVSPLSCTTIYRVNGGSWQNASMILIGPETYRAILPPQSPGAQIELYLRAIDGASNQSVDPAGAPGQLYRIRGDFLFFDEAEREAGWTLARDTDSNEGRWARLDPVGTQSGGEQIEPADDHSSAPGTQCFVTGAGGEGVPAESSDVDNGCVTLLSPIFDLSAHSDVIASYWRWFALAVTQSGYLAFSASNDGGESWTLVDIAAGMENHWTQIEVHLAEYLPLTDQMRFRFLCCDSGAESLVEGAVDDFGLRRVAGPSAIDAESAPPRVELYPVRSRAGEASVTLPYALTEPGIVLLTIHDAQGRRVRSLVSGFEAAGAYSVSWDARSDGGASVPRGIYFARLEVGDIRLTRKFALL